MHDKSTVNIIPKDDILKIFPVNSGTRQGCPLLKLLFNIELQVLPEQLDDKNETMQIRKKEVKLSLFVDDII